MNKNIIVLASIVHAHYWYMEQLPASQQHCKSTDFFSEIGGKGLNVTCALQALGIPVYPIAGIGADHTAQLCIELFQSLDICTDYLYVIENVNSGNGAAFIDQHGNNMLAINLGSNLYLKEHHILEAWENLPSACLIYAQFETSIEAIESAFKLSSMKTLNVLNPSPWQQPSVQLTASTDILIVNETEFSALSACSADDLHRFDQSRLNDFLHYLNYILNSWLRLKILVITLGEQGAIAVYKTQQSLNIWQIQAIDIEANDSTGCGDVFSAVFCQALVYHQSVPIALEKANLAGAWIAAHQGILQHLPSEEILEKFKSTVQYQTAVQIL